MYRSQYYRFALTMTMLSLASQNYCQRIAVKIPPSVNKEYKYSFVANDDYIIGLPGLAGIDGKASRFCVWNAKNGKYRHSFERTNVNNHSSVLSYDGRWVAYNPSSEKLYIIDALKDVVRDTLAFHPAYPLRDAVRFSPNSQLLVYSPFFHSDTSYLYEMHTRRRILVKGFYDLSQTRFSEDGRFVYMYSLRGSFTKIQCSDGQTLAVIKLPQDINRLSIYLQIGLSRDGSFIQVIDGKKMCFINSETGAFELLDNIATSTKVQDTDVCFVQDNKGKHEVIHYNLKSGVRSVLSTVGSTYVDLKEADDFLIVNDHTDLKTSFSGFSKKNSRLVFRIQEKFKDEYIQDFAVSPSGNYYGVVTNENFYVLQIASKNPLFTFSTKESSYFKNAIFFSNDETKVGLKTENKVILFNLASQQLYAALDNGGNSNDYDVLGFSGPRHIAVETYENIKTNIAIDSLSISTDRAPSPDDYSPDRSRFIRSNFMGNISLYDAIRGSEIKNISLDISGFNIVFFPRKKWFGVYDVLPCKFYLFDLETGNQVWSKTFQDCSPRYIFDREGKVFIAEGESVYTVVDLATGREIGKIKNNGLEPPVIDEKSAYIYVVDATGKVQAWNTNVFAKTPIPHSMSVELKKTHYADFADSFRCVRVGSYGAGKFYDTLFRFQDESNYSRGNYLTKESPNHELLIVYYGHDNMEVWNLEQKKCIWVLDISGVQVVDIYISPDNKRIAVKGLQKEVLLFDLPSKKFIGTLYFSKEKEKEVMFVTGEGYYKIGKQLSTLLSFSVGENHYEFDQFDLRYNRPDKVLQSLGSSDSSLINTYRLAYNKRIQRMKLDTLQFQSDFKAPNLEIINTDQLDKLPLKTTVANIVIHAYDPEPTNYLTRIFITVNGNPAYGYDGLNIEQKNCRDTTLQIPLLLAEGNNTIKVSCVNNRSAESYRQTVSVTCQLDKPVAAKTWFIGIGISNYKDKAYELNFPCKNILQLDSFFTHRRLGRHAHHILLLDSQAKRENIVAVKHGFLKNVQPNDIIILALSGHGTIDYSSPGKEFYFATWDMNFQKKSDYGLSYDDIQWLLDSIPAQNKLVILDACRSGELDTDSSEQGIRSFELMQEMFANLGKGNGSTVFSATAGNKDGYEPPELGNSIFMYYLLQGLNTWHADENNDGSINLSELQNFVDTKVVEYSGERQKPNSRIFNYDNDWIVKRRSLKN